MKSRTDPYLLVFVLMVLTISFFLGGILLDLNAAGHGIKWIAKLGVSDKENPFLQQAIAFQQARDASIQQAAAAAFDIAKVSLGALVSSIAHLLSMRSADPKSPQPSDPSENEPT